MDSLYNYLCGKEFQHRVATTVDTAIALKDDLDAEKRSIERQWGKREKQIEHLLRNSAGMYGELQAIVGDALHPVPLLELPPGADDTGEPLALVS